MGGAIHCTTHRRQVRNLVSLVHGCAGCFTVGSTWRFHAIWTRQEPHVVHQRTIRPYPKQQKDHNGRAQCSRIALSTTLSQDTGKTGGIMTGSPLRGGGVPPRGYHTNGRCGPTTRSLLHRSNAHTVLRARMVPACAARAFTDRGSRPQVPHSGHRGRQAPREQTLWAHHVESRGAIAQNWRSYHATCPHGAHLCGALVLGQRQHTPGNPQRAQGWGGRWYLANSR